MNALFAERLKWVKEHRIATAQSDWEMSTVFDILVQRGFAPSTFLEIGSAWGMSLYCYSSLCKPGAVVRSVDIGFRAGNCIPTLEATVAQLNADGLDAKWLRADSTLPETIAEVKAAFPNGVEFMHIDGNHMAEAVTLDYNNYIGLLRPSGIALFHDTVVQKHNCEVWKVWPEFRKDYLWAEFCAGRGGFGIGLLERRR